MKITRQKHAKKNLNFYKHNFRFREPYQVLLDGTFCQAALKNQIQIKEQMPKYLMGEVQLCTTNCVIKELESLGKELYGAKLIAQRFQVRSCAHSQSPVSGSACLLSMVADDNSHHYFIATQDQELANKVKKKSRHPPNVHHSEHNCSRQAVPQVGGPCPGPAGQPDVSRASETQDRAFERRAGGLPGHRTQREEEETYRGAQSLKLLKEKEENATKIHNAGSRAEEEEKKEKEEQELS